MGFLQVMLFTIGFFTFMFIAGAGYYNSPMTTVLGGGIDKLIGSMNFYDFIGLAIGGALVTLIGQGLFPNPWVYFVAPAVFMAGWLTYPKNLFNPTILGSDAYTQLILSSIQTILLVIGTITLMSWFKGQETVW